MDSAIDTLSTTSEHSVASSIDSVQTINCASPRELESVSSISLSTMNNPNDKRSSPHYTLNNNTAAAMNQMLMQQQSQQQTPPNSGGATNGGVVSNRNRASSCSPPTMSPSRHPQPPSPAAAAAAALNHSMMQQMQQHHQHSPPPNGGGLPAGMPPRMPHGLPPHSLGLLNSLQMMHHASPLELMAAAHHHVPPRSYNSPPPISTSDPSANECKLVEYRGQKVAAFIISGETMLCLPQAFELFLKHLVGGLHTVYTKLKRLDIVPLVCNVEQVRILRGLGAIQPGVNRCKLLSCKDFDVLYRDCTTARCLSIKPPESSRPGRPPKRGPVGLSLPPSHLSQHPQLKKHRLDNGDYAYENGHINDISRLEKSPLLANGYNPPPINHMAFMQMNHHPGSALMSPGMPPHGLHGRPDSQMLKAAAQSGMSAASMDAIARSGIWENCRAAYEDIVKHLERLREERTDDRQQMNDQKPRDLSSRNCSPSRQSPVLNLSKSGGATDHGSNCDDRSDRSDEVHSPPPSVRGDDENLSDDNGSEVDDHIAKEEDLSDSERDISSAQHQAISVTSNSGDRDLHHSHHSAHSHHQPHQQSSTPHHHHHHHQRALNYSTLAATAAAAAVAASGVGVGGGGVVGGVVSGGVSSGAGSATGSTTSMGNGGGVGVTLNDGLPPSDAIVGLEQQSTSSTETLLRNIQSLLKVAADNARQQERQISYEKAELKMDVMREREVKDSLERQLVDERKLRVLYQKRYRRERKIRIRYQQQLDGKRKGQSVHADDREVSKGLSESGKNGQDIDCKSSEKSDKSSTNDRHRRSESPTFKREPIDRDTRSSADRMDRERERERERERDREHDRSSERECSVNQVSPLLPPTSQAESGLIAPGSGKAPWNYPGIDLMATGAFWQNYSETLAQEIEMERKSRAANADRDVKSPLQERQQSYYKNSVLFGSAT